MAITQYDTALASIWDSYDEPDQMTILDVPSVDQLRRIVVMHREIFHALIRWDDQGPERLTLSVLQGARVCLGAPGSGTQLLAKALLKRHGVVPEKAVLLSVPDMVARIHNGELDAGFFMSAIPSEALKTVVNDTHNRFLSTDPRSVARLLGPQLKAARIEPGTYGAQRPEEYIDTVSTQAVLVARQGLSVDLVETLTGAIFEMQDFIGIPGDMSEDLSSLELHPGALAYYQEAGIYPSPVPITLLDLLDFGARTLAILVILVGGYQGVLKLRRDVTSSDIGRRVLAISVEPDEPESVRKLLEIRDAEIRDRAQLHWWRNGELDRSRWRDLHNLIDDRIKIAKENLTAALAEDLRIVGHESNLTIRRERFRALQDRAWRYFQSGELDTSHQAMLMEVIQVGLSEQTEGTE